MRLHRPYARWRQRGFTLIELLLVVTLVLALASAMVFNFTNLLRGNQLEEGTTRLETLMRFARAQAANSGRKVQLVFGPELTNTTAATTGEVRATWEPDPLRQPGSFTDLCEAQWHVQEVNDLVQVESVKLLEPSNCGPAPQELPDESIEISDIPAGKPMGPITFYPDGSSDSAEIIVAARTPDEEQRMSVRLIGMTGSISHQRLTSLDFEDSITEPGSLDRSFGGRRGTITRDPATDLDATPRPISTRPPASSSRSVPTAFRATVGETNTVDYSE